MLAMQVLQQIVWQMGALVCSPVFWLMTGIVYLQIRHQAKRKEEMFQVRREPVIGRAVITVLAGLAGGMLASGLLLVLGVSADCVGLEYLWVIALLLMLIRQRFLCFAYAGGILACCSCLTGWPQIDVSQLLAMIAVLHCTEAFLVLITGHGNALPVYLLDENSRITGGFLLQMTWPLPMIMLFAMAGTAPQPQAGFLLFPDWWPVIGQNAGHSTGILYLMLPVLAALSYCDIAVSRSIRQKTAQSAGLLLAYSACLLFLVIWTDDWGLRQLIPALFAPLGHELVIHCGKRSEMSGAGRYRAPDRGVLILDVQHGSPAARAGLRREDWIVQLDGRTVNNRQSFLRQQYLLPAFVTVRYVRGGKQRTCCIRMKNWSQPGIITAPDDSCEIYWTLQNDDGIVKFLYKMCEKTLKNMR